MTKPVDIKDLQSRAHEVSGLLKTLSHPNRLLIACCLTEREKSVGEIEKDTDIAQPHVSRELARLREAGLVSARRESKNVFYKIADQRLAYLIDALCRAFGGEGEVSTRTKRKRIKGGRK